MEIKELHQLFQEHPVVCTDTRKITERSIFFALKGDNFNGNKFAQQALDSGAEWAVIDESEFEVEGKTILVDNVYDLLSFLSTSETIGDSN